MTIQFIPGFRSNTTWKKVVAVIYYLISLTSIFSLDFGAFIMMMSSPFIVFAVIGMVKSKAKKNALIVFIVSMLVLMIGSGLDAPRRNAIAVANAKVVAHQEVVAKAKAVVAKRIAEAKAIADKKIADAKIASDAKIQAQKDAKAQADADALVLQKQEQQQKFVTDNTKTLSSGDYTVGSEIGVGIYDFTFSGTGNLTVDDANGNNITNEVGGNADGNGITKYRSMLIQDSKVNISGMSMNIVPATQTLAPYAQTSIYAGYWIVGKDITAGRYTISTTENTGNLMISDSSGASKTNEVLGKSQYAVPSTVVDLADGDIIQVSGLNNVSLTPSN
ncbi:MAG TPA: hypothetical protein VIM42_07635 [Clostridium sp.]